MTLIVTILMPHALGAVAPCFARWVDERRASAAGGRA
jgi:hypothetical protein